MMKFLFPLVCLLSACTARDNGVKKNNIDFSKFPAVINPVFKNVIITDNGVIGAMYLTDSTILAYDWRGTNGNFFNEYSLKTTKLVATYLPLGRTSGKTLGAISTGFFKDAIWMFDINLKKIISLKLNQSKFKPIVYNELPFSKFYYSLQFIDSLKVIGNGYYETPNTIQEIELLTQKVTADYGKPDDPPVGVPQYAWKRANEGFSALKPDGKKLVIAHLWSDKLEIFNLKNKTRILVSGPQNAAAEFHSFKSDRQDVIQKTDKSIHAFSTVFATDNYIYALYSGNNMSSPYINYGKRIFVYNWEGKPVREINFNDYASCFTVSSDDKVLYIYNVLTKFIMAASL